MEDYIVSQRRGNSAHQSMGMYTQPTNGVQTVVTTEPPEPVGGGRSYAFWLLVAVVLLVAVFNLLITLTLISVLRISVGMESVQFVAGGMVLPGTVDLDRLYKPDGQFLGFNNEPMTITGDVGQVDLLVSDAPDAGFEPAESQRVRLSPSSQKDSSQSTDGVRVEGVQRAAVSVSPTSHPSSAAGTGAAFFSTDFPNFGLPDGVRSLRVKEARTRRVVSPVDKSLRLQSSTQVHMKGSEGTYIDGKEIILSADQELHLKSVNGSVVMSGAGGVRLDVRSIPWAQGRSGAADGRAAYRLCACVHFPGGKQDPDSAVVGRLFRIPVPVGNGDLLQNKRVTCGNATLNGENNPCV